MTSSTQLPSQEDVWTAYHQAAFDDPMRPLLLRFAMGRLVDREAIDYEAAFRILEPSFDPRVVGVDGWMTARDLVDSAFAAALGDTDDG